MSHRRLTVTLLAVSSLLVVGCAQELKSGNGLHIGTPVDVNDVGSFVGVDYADGKPHAALLSGVNGTLTTIEGPNGAGFVPHAMNNSAVIVGALITGSGKEQTQRAVSWTGGQGFLNLPLPEGTFQSWATDINNVGQIVLNAFSPSGSPNDGAYIFNPRTNRLDRETEPPGAPNGRASVAEAINDSGYVVGASGNGSPAGHERAVEWNPDRIVEYLEERGTGGHAYGINAWNTVVGSAETGAAGAQLLHAAVWLASGKVQADLGPGLARAINDRGLVVGQDAAETTPRAAGWFPFARGAVIHPVSQIEGSSSIAAINNASLAAGEVEGKSAYFSLPTMP